MGGPLSVHVKGGEVNKKLKFLLLVSLLFLIPFHKAAGKNSESFLPMQTPKAVSFCLLISGPPGAIWVPGL